MSCLFPWKKESIAIEGSPFGSTYSAWLPCGQCIECRLSRARSWATRCTHEATQWKHSCFITLTYAEVPLDKEPSLNPQDTRDFIRRLRRNIGTNFKYFLVGEYGEKGNRPHYHALIFGYDFGLHKLRSRSAMDLLSVRKQLHKVDLAHNILDNTEAVRTDELDEIWGHGFTSVGDLSFDSAAYTAQYAIKKVNGASSEQHYRGRHPEFMRQSKNAIGKQYANKFASEIILHNSVISNDTEQPIPRYYLKQFEKNPNLDLSDLKQRRESYSSEHSIAESYRRAVEIDKKFRHKNRLSRADKFRIRYAKDLFFTNVT